MPMPDRDRFLYDLQGYLVVRDVLGPDHLKALHEGIDRHAGTARDDARAARSAALSAEKPRRILAGMLGWERPWSQPFRDLLVHPTLVPYLNEMLAPGWHLDQEPFAILCEEGSEGAVMHGSTRIDPTAGFFYRFEGGRMHSGMIVVEYVLTDHDAGDGGFACIPGSHKSDVPCPESIKDWETDNDVVVQPVVKAGDVVIFNEATLHGTLPWKRHEERRVLLYRYSPRYLTAGGGIGVGQELPAWASELTEVERSILRPASIEVTVLDDDGVLQQ